MMMMRVMKTIKLLMMMIIMMKMAIVVVVMLMMLMMMMMMVVVSWRGDKKWQKVVGRQNLKYTGCPTQPPANSPHKQHHKTDLLPCTSTEHTSTPQSTC